MSKEKQSDAATTIQAKVAEYTQQLQETNNQLEMLQSRREQLKGAIFALQNAAADLSKQAKEEEIKEELVEKSEAEAEA